LKGLILHDKVNLNASGFWLKINVFFGIDETICFKQNAENQMPFTNNFFTF